MFITWMPSVAVQQSMRLSRPAVLINSASDVMNTGYSHDLHEDTAMLLEAHLKACTGMDECPESPQHLTLHSLNSPGS